MLYELVIKLPKDNQDFFIKLYGNDIHNNISEVVEYMDSDKIDHAFTQVENTFNKMM